MVEKFWSCYHTGMSFPAGKLPIKRPVVGRMLNFPDLLNTWCSKECCPRSAWKIDMVAIVIMFIHSMGRHYTIPTSLAGITPYPSFMHYLATFLAATSVLIIRKIQQMLNCLSFYWQFTWWKWRSSFENFSTMHIVMVVPEGACFLVYIVLFSLNCVV